MSQALTIDNAISLGSTDISVSQTNAETLAIDDAISFASTDISNQITISKGKEGISIIWLPLLLLLLLLGKKRETKNI